MTTNWPTNGGLANLAYERIRGDVIRCMLDPGLRVTRAQLEERYGLGAAPIREALARLCHEGLVQVIPREAYVIAPMTLKQVHDIFDARLVLEPIVARLAAGRIDATQIRRLRELDVEVVESYDGAEHTHLEKRFQANRAVHLAIAQSTGNERLVEIVASLHVACERVFHLSFLLAEQLGLCLPSRSHEPTIAALEAGDGALAEQLMADEIRMLKAYALDALHTNPSVQSVNLVTTTA